MKAVDFIKALDNKTINKIRTSMSDAEARRILRQELENLEPQNILKNKK